MLINAAITSNTADTGHAESPFPDRIVRLFASSDAKPGGVVIVVPCYNEAARLDVASFIRYLDQATGIRFVFVNDGSRDNTLQVLDTIHAAHPERVEILSLRKNSGKAEAVRQGLLHAVDLQAEMVGYWDADLATPLDAIDDFIRIGRRYQDVEVIYGSRLQLLGHRIARKLSRRIVSRICARLARLAVGLPIGDTQCGAKLLRNSPKLATSLAHPFSAGWLFDVELFSRLAAGGRARGAFYEFPLPEWTEVPGSKVTARAIRRAGVAMLKLIAEKRFGFSALATKSEPAEVTVMRRAGYAIDQAA